MWAADALGRNRMLGLGVVLAVGVGWVVRACRWRRGGESSREQRDSARRARVFVLL